MTKATRGAPPWWISPWSLRRAPDGNVYHSCTVARTRADRHTRRVVITVPDDALRGLDLRKRQELLTPKIVAALQQLGIVKKPESGLVTATH